MKLFTRNNPLKHPMLSQINATNNEYEVVKIKKYFNIIYVMNVNNKESLIVADDPISLCLAFVCRIFYLKKHHIRFWMLEINEHQLPVNSFKRKIRALVFRATTFISIKYSDTLVFPSMLRMKYAIDRYKIINTKKCSVVLNIPNIEHERKKLDEAIFTKVTEIKKSYQIIAIYAGSLQDGRGLEELLDKFNDQKTGALIICGEDRNNLFARNNRKLNNIFYLGSLNYNQLFELYCLCDVGILTYENSPLNVRFCAPVKIWEYIACGLKIVGNDNFALRNEWSKYVDEFYNNDKNNIDSILVKLKNSPAKERLNLRFDVDKITSI